MIIKWLIHTCTNISSVFIQITFYKKCLFLKRRTLSWFTWIVFITYINMSEHTYMYIYWHLPFKNANIVFYLLLFDASNKWDTERGNNKYQSRDIYYWESDLNADLNDLLR